MMDTHLKLENRFSRITLTISTNMESIRIRARDKLLKDYIYEQ